MTSIYTRRSFLQLSVALASAGVGLRTSFAAPASGDARFVFVILRGALDGLAAVPPHGDPDYARLRGALAIAPPGASDGALPLDATFGLHPAFAYLHSAYQARELLVLHAVATPYRERSHFDGQDVLESGLPTPHASPSGWLNRALQALPASPGRGREPGVALGQNVPLVLRGAAPIASWSPSSLPQVDEDTLARIAERYAPDALLSQRLSEALAAEQLAAEVSDSDPTQAPTMGSMQAAARAPVARYEEVVRTAGAFLRRPDGPSVAVFDTSGWDTHFNEGGAQGQLRARLSALDQGLSALREALGPVWSRTVVLLATEFGRTAAANGTRGTDHGTGAAAFLLGGAVAGGRVRADWPGLSAAALYQNRDLRPTCDLRQIVKSVLHDHLGVSAQALDQRVFPDSGGYLSGLLRSA
jgi:uncharacterized protein (DUF1501 family)